jgi:serine/threonine protein kinase
VIDYGLAWVKGEPKGRVQGTPEYMAPEQAKHGQVTERTDIYNFGATMYRLTTWRLPPSIVGTEGGMMQQMTGKTWAKLVKPVSEFNAAAPPKLCQLIHQCLDYNAQNRPERMSEIQGTLDHLVDELVRSPDDRLEAMEF